MTGIPRNVSTLGIAAIVAATTWLVAPGAGAAFELMPHRAIYDVSLASARSGSGIATVTGEFLAEWSEQCAGWTLDHRSRLDVTYAPGRTIRLISSVATWESRDGGDYRFDVTNSANGRVTERIAGRATQGAPDRPDRPGRPGQVVYDEPAGRIDALPAGTVFPTTHSVRVLAAAANAPTIVAMPVFDGMTLDGAFSISAFLGRARAPALGRARAPALGRARAPALGRARAPASEPGKPLAALDGLLSFPLRMAFFPVAGRGAEPSHEIGMVMYENGVGDDLMLEFSDFTVRARLIRLEMGERPDCGT